MPRSVPAADRVIATLNFLADHPGESFSLSQIASALGLSKTTAHAMLGTLVNGDYLVRHPSDKSYSLGPALVGLGHAAVASTTKIATLAQPVMNELSAAASAQCVATTVQGEEMVIIATAGAASTSTSMPVGYRSRLAPPAGAIFVAWASAPRMERWLERLPSATNDRERGRTLLQIVRSRGFSASGEPGPEQQLDSILRHLPGRQANPHERAIALDDAIRLLAPEEEELLAINPDTTYRLRQLSAPVFDATAAARLSLMLVMLGEVTGSRLLELSAALRAATTAVTATIGGAPPDAPIRNDRPAGSL